MDELPAIPTLETVRLILLPWKLEYAEDMLIFASNINVVSVSDGWKLIDTTKKATAVINKFIKNHSTDESKKEWAVALKNENKIIGSIGQFRNPSNALGYDNIINFGWLLAEEYWGQGLMTEAAKEIMRYNFMELKCDVMTVDHRVGNIRSKRVIEKCGFKLRGIFPKKAPYDPNSKACYVLTRYDYMDIFKESLD